MAQFEEHPKHYTKLDILAAFRFGKGLKGDGKKNLVAKENGALWDWLTDRIKGER